MECGPSVSRSQAGVALGHGRGWDSWSSVVALPRGRSSVTGRRETASLTCLRENWSYFIFVIYRFLLPCSIILNFVKY